MPQAAAGSTKASLSFIPLSLILLIGLTKWTAWALVNVDQPDEAAKMMHVYLEVEALLADSDDHRYDAAARGGDGHEHDANDFLLRAVAKMHTNLELLTNEASRPESSSRAASRVDRSNLLRKLISAYHEASLGECDQLQEQAGSIGSKVAEIGRVLDTSLPNVSKYLAALFDLCQPNYDDEHDSGKSWFDRLWDGLFS
jgi:hypothetical protein